VRGWRVPKLEPIPSTIISGVNACLTSQIIERYSPPFDIRFEYPKKFQTLRNGLQEALIRTSQTPCVDPVIFRKWFKVQCSRSENCLSLLSSSSLQLELHFNFIAKASPDRQLIQVSFSLPSSLPLLLSVSLPLSVSPSPSPPSLSERPAVSSVFYRSDAPLAEGESGEIRILSGVTAISCSGCVSSLGSFISAQVWTYSPLLYTFLVEEIALPEQRVFLVPLWNLVDSGKVFPRVEPLPGECGRVDLVTVFPPTKISGCAVNLDNCKPRSACPRAEVVFFAKNFMIDSVFAGSVHLGPLHLTASRKPLDPKRYCIKLHKLIEGSVGCFSGGAWADNSLPALLTSTSIVILLGFIQPSYNSHLVDSLLMHGLVIVSTHSNGHLSLVSLVVSSRLVSLSLLADDGS
jgi:hypothetical protein